MASVAYDDPDDTYDNALDTYDGGRSSVPIADPRYTLIMATPSTILYAASADWRIVIR